MPIQVWILALAAIAGIIGLAVLVLRRSGAAASGNAELPTEWPLTQRPIFSPEERALYRQLRTALPQAVEPLRLQLQILSAVNQIAEIAEPLRTLIGRTPKGERWAYRTGSQSGCCSS